MEISKKPIFGEFDLVKALALLGLPFVHFIEEGGYECGYIANYDPVVFDTVIFLTVFGPAIFMMCMGARIPSNYSSKRLIKNGIQFLIIGYLLNFICFTVPQLIYAAKFGVIQDGENLFYTAWQDMFGADIYIFVGWVFLFYGILRKCFKNITTFQLICISGAMLLVNNYIGHTIDLDYSVATQLIGNFVTVNDQSYFPLFGWAIFVFAGMAMRDYLKAGEEKSYHQRMTRLMILGFGGLVLMFAALDVYEISVIDILLNFTQNYTMDIFTVCILMLLSLGVMGAMSKLYHAIKENALERFLMRISSFIMSYYLIQWMLVAFVVYWVIYLHFDIEGLLPMEVATALMVLIFAMSLFLTSKFGYSFMRFVLKITDYSKWFKKKPAKKIKA